ncbi:MAG: type II secretion system F family protein [Candidatus Omnitrophota bacterium]
MLVILQLLILILLFASVYLIAQPIIPFVTDKLQRAQAKKVSQAEKQLDEMFLLVKREKLFLYYTLSPVVLAGLAMLLFHQVVIAVIAGAVGFLLPAFVIKQMEIQRKEKFLNQLVDGLMIVSSSLKGGLSFIQAIEVLVEEMPPPISQEFGLILRENKIGLTLEDSLKRLNDRLKMNELGLVINSILVARETGGDLTKVFSKLCSTFRDNHKLKENIRTLTLQGRLQGIIMSVLPIVFVWWVLTFNRQHFDIMLNTEQGRMLLLVAVVLQIVGVLLIRKFSMVRI